MRQLFLLFALLLSVRFFGQNLSTSLTACYALNGDAKEPINFLTGTLSAVSPTVDRFNNSNSALAFSGSTSSYIQLPLHPLIMPTTSLSISMWVRPTALGLKYMAFAWNGCTSYFEGYCIVVNNYGNGNVFGINKASSACSGTGQIVAQGTTTITTSTWYHVGAYFGNDSIKLYLNGVLDASASVSAGFTYSTMGVVLGGTNRPNFNNPYSGSMDNVRFYNRKLSGQEFLQLYQTDPTCVEPMIPTTASFTAPDTICINQSAQPNNTSTGTVTSNYWSVCNSTTVPTPVVSSINVTGSSGPVYMTINKDGTDYYSFVTGNVGNNLMRLYYGNSLSNTPTLTNLGTFSSALTQAEGIHIQKEGSNWYGIVVGSSSPYIARLSFGTTLANSPTVTNLGNIGNLSYPHNIHVFKSGNNYYGLVLNQSNATISRLNFGNSIANTPTATALGMNTAVSSTVFNTPSQMQVISHNGNWHVFVVNDGSSYSLTRLDFGNSLLNVPTATVLGNPGSLLNGPRGIVLWPECGGIRGLIANRNSNQLLNVSIPGGPTGPVTLSSSGISAPLSFPQTMMRVRVGDTSFVYVVNVSNNSLTLLKFPTCTSVPSSTLQNPAMTFSTAGNYTMSLATNEDLADGSKYCKQLTVIPNFAVSATVSPVLACSGASRTLTASGASSYTWYPGGLNGSAVTVTPGLASMVYTVVGAIGSCTAQQVFTVSTLAGSSVSVTVSPAAVCPGNTSTLTGSGALTYSWQPGNSLGGVLIVTPFATTQFTLSGTNAVGCITSTIVTLTVTPYPSLVISPATRTVCSGSAITLTATGAANYTWTPVNVFTNTLQVSPTANTIYSLAGATNGCPSSTTVQVTVISTPTVLASANTNTSCSGSPVVLSASGAGSYTWLPPNSNGSTITVLPSSTTIYTVRGSNGACTGTAAVQVTVFPLPVLFPGSPTPSICAGDPALLTASNAATYTWQPGNMLVQTPTVAPLVTTIYTVSGTGTAGCIGSGTFMLVVHPLPTISINPSSATICAPGPLTLTASGASSYTWLPVNAGGSSISPTLSANTVFTVNGVLSGCPGTATSSVFVNPSPTVVATAGSPSVCSGNSVTLSASGAVSYQWLPGGQTTQSITFFPASSAVYTVTGTNSFGCSRSATVGVTVAPTPTVSTSIAASNTVCTGNSYTITASGATSFSWNTGANTAAIIITPLTNNTTSYIVTGSVGACASTATRVVTAISTPTVFAVANPTSVCAGSTVNLVAGGATNYTWYLPSAFTGNNFNVLPTSSILYTVVGTTGGCSGVTTVSVTVNPNPTITVSSSNNPGCSGSSIQLTGGGASTYTWLPGNQNTQVITVNPSATTVYTLIGRTAAGCAGAISYAQVMVPYPVISIVTTASSVCAGHSVGISASGGGPSTSYTLLPGGFVGNNFVRFPLVSTTYTVLGRNGNCISGSAVYITVLPSPSVTAVTSDTQICRGETVTLTATGATNYTWVPGPFFQAQVVVTPTTSVLYQVIGSNSAGCTGSANLVVIVNPLPPLLTVTVSGVASQNYICAGNSVTLTAMGQGFPGPGSSANFTWYPPGQVGHTIIVSPSVSTIYTVYGKTYTWQPCPAIGTVAINVSPAPVPNIGMSADKACQGGTVVLTATGASSFMWFPGGSHAAVLTVTPSVTTTYTLIGANGPNCTAMSLATVTVYPKPQVSASAPASVCAGSTATVTLSGANGYLWNGTALNGSVVLVPVQNAQTYTAIGFDGNGCSDTVLVNLGVSPTPSTGIDASSTVLCAGSSVTLQASGAGPFTWYPDKVEGGTLVSSPFTTTTYTLVNGTGNCQGQALITVSVTPCELPLFGLTNAATTPQLFNSNYYLVQFIITVVNQSKTGLNEIELRSDLASTFHEPVTYTLQETPLIRSANSGLRINSNFNGSSDLSITSPGTSSLAPMKTDTIVLKLLVDPHGFSGLLKNSVVGSGTTPWSLVVSDSSNNGFQWDPDKDGNPNNNNVPTTIDIKAIDLFIPNAFSPDGDGYYDVLVIKGLNDVSANFTVFNRWGNKVYEASGTKIAWDGYANSGLVAGNGKVPPGTYYYVLEFPGKDNTTSLKGYVVIQY